MRPRFTDGFRLPRGYVRSESTDITKTWAAARKLLAPAPAQPETKVVKLHGDRTHARRS